MAIYRPRTEASGGTSPANPFILDPASRAVRKDIWIVEASQLMVLCYGGLSKVTQGCSVRKDAAGPILGVGCDRNSDPSREYLLHSHGRARYYIC